MSSNFKDFIISTLQNTASKQELDSEITQIFETDVDGKLIGGKMKDAMDDLIVLDDDNNLESGKLKNLFEDMGVTETDIHTGKVKVRNSIALKADANSVYTKTEVDTSMSSKADVDSVYTKSEIDTSLESKADIFNKISETADAVVIDSKLQIQNNHIEFLRPNDGGTAASIDYQFEGLILKEERGGDTTSIQFGSEDITMKTNHTERLLIKKDGNIEMKSNAVYIGETGDSEATIFMSGGASLDSTYEHSVIETRKFDTDDNSELLLFKGNDATPSSNTDRIRLRSGEIAIDSYTGSTTDRHSENIIAKFNSDGLTLKGILSFSHNQISSLTTNLDGALYRYNSQLEMMVDDNFYIRDADNTGTPEFHFSTDGGFTMYKGQGSSKSGTSAGFVVNSDGTNDRVVISQIEDGGGGYWYWNRSFNNGKVSDSRLKENIEDVADTDIDFLMRMQPKKYKMKDLETDCCQYGLIAQEVLAECQTMHQKLIVNNAEDYLADSNTDKLLGISYESFIPLLIKTVQVQDTKIKTLEAEIEAIKAQLA